LGGGTAGLRRINQRTACLLHPEALGDIRSDRLDLDTHPPARNVTLVFELGHDRLGGLRRNIEADADRSARWREDCGIYADYIAADVESGTAGVALVDRGVDLNVVIRTRSDVAPTGRDNACRDGATKTEWVA